MSYGKKKGGEKRKNEKKDALGVARGVMNMLSWEPGRKAARWGKSGSPASGAGKGNEGIQIMHKEKGAGSVKLGSGAAT